jgi:hypothetical protein
LEHYYNILAFAGFLALAIWSSLRKLRWPVSEFSIATGLGIEYFALFVIAILQCRWNSGIGYRRLYEAGLGVYLAVMAYWLHYFWIRAERVSMVRSARQPTSAAR